MEFENNENKTEEIQEQEPVNSKRNKKPFFIGLSLGVILSGVFYSGVQFGNRSGVHNVQVSVSNQGSPGKEAQPKQIVSKIAQEKGPAVVSIDTTSVAKSPVYNFNAPFGMYGDNSQNQQSQEALGSGFVFDKSGYILTNDHVVNGATSIKVKVMGYNQPFDAKLIGEDPDQDVAIVKINVGKDLPYLTFGNNDEANVGDAVIAIGNPYGLDHTVTTGVLSAKGRPLAIENKQFTDLLQTDASINPGNSGGPLLDLNGNVIGINTAINAEAQNIGFAIPINDVQKLIKPLLTSGNIQKPFIGVAMQTITKDIATYYGLNQNTGVVITEIVPNSPASNSGLQQGDIIVGIDKKKITTSDEVVNVIGKKKIGDKISLLIFTNGQMKTVEITIGAKP